ncbi:DUF4445 domain-containing protein [bacterium]|nr:DUF4445 domain-containing protein [bacterium]
MNITLTSGQALEIEKGQSINDALKGAGIHLTTSCGGKGTCGKCKVIVNSGGVKSDSQMKLTPDEIAGGFALACKTYAEEDLGIDIPKESVLTVEGQIATEKTKDLLAAFKAAGAEIAPFTSRILLKLSPPTIDDNIGDLERLKRELAAQGHDCIRVPYRILSNMAHVMREGDWNVTLSMIDTEDCHEITNIFPGDKTALRYGVAIDIGTTTVVAYIVNLTTGELIDVGSVYNSQIRYGDDVITRIVNATEHNELKGIHGAVLSDINLLLSTIMKEHNIASDSIDCFVVAGNTTMTQLFLGLDPAAIREEPYIPTANHFPLAYAGELKLNVHPNVPIYSFPCIASYVGGDIVSGILAVQMHKEEEICMFIDIGTNGEIVIGNSEWLMAAACSAGPCFEGSGIIHGMRATEGAIENVSINRETGDVTIGVIGNGRPMGICGSGMIDAISEMFLAGILNQKGKLQEGVSERVRAGTDGPEFVIHYGEGRDIVLSEPDIENLVRAKAAIYAGFATLLNEVGFTFDDVSKVYIAGGFGRFLDIEKAITIGMLPEMAMEKFEYKGNTSVAGTYMCLLSKELRTEAEQIASQMTYVELSVNASFMDEYMSGLFLPHTNMAAFPGVQAKMVK